jgi:hypothetical protein
MFHKKGLRIAPAFKSLPAGLQDLSRTATLHVMLSERPLSKVNLNATGSGVSNYAAGRKVVMIWLAPPILGQFEDRQKAADFTPEVV